MLAPRSLKSVTTQHEQLTTLRGALLVDLCEADPLTSCLPSEPSSGRRSARRGPRRAWCTTVAALRAHSCRFRSRALWRTRGGCGRPSWHSAFLSTFAAPSPRPSVLRRAASPVAGASEQQWVLLVCHGLARILTRPGREQRAGAASLPSSRQCGRRSDGRRGARHGVRTDQSERRRHTRTPLSQWACRAGGALQGLSHGPRLGTLSRASRASCRLVSRSPRRRAATEALASPACRRCLRRHLLSVATAARPCMQQPHCRRRPALRGTVRRGEAEGPLAEDRARGRPRGCHERRCCSQDPQEPTRSSASRAAVACGRDPAEEQRGLAEAGSCS